MINTIHTKSETVFWSIQIYGHNVWILMVQETVDWTHNLELSWWQS
jgi:hypothetical protein